MLHEDLTAKILQAYFTVYNILGYGFLEKVYENALFKELLKQGLMIEQQRNIKVYYDGAVVGDYYADLLIENRVIVEMKCVDHLCEEHEAQLLNYLRATTIEVGILLNFGKKPEIKRKVFTNEQKFFNEKKNVPN
ncbi:MAG: GxxExxY protein [Bacteroidetes bacterium]|nr:GxxExxY protein [Bacteroidota bacterium]